MVPVDSICSTTQDTAQGHKPDNSVRQGVFETLVQLKQLLEQNASTFEAEVCNVVRLLERQQSGRFHLAVLGQFKRGKSTLLNALLGDAVLPTAVVPLTAIPTFIRPGETLSARVIFQNDHADEVFVSPDLEAFGTFLARFVTEEGNPKNILGVQQVEVSHSSPMLTKGVVLIDTPGIGSTFRHNTEATLNFLPQCDAALFLVSADPPLTEVEVAFLKQVRKKVPRLFFILNKVDYLNASDKAAALSFLRKVLREQAEVDDGVPIFCVSARQGLEARLTHDAALWNQSGMALVEQHLLEFLVDEKTHALNDALRRKAYNITADVLMRLHLAMRSLEMPLEDLQARLRVFETKIMEIQQKRLSVADMLAGDRRRTQEFLEYHVKILRDNAQKRLNNVVMNALNGNGGEMNTKSAVQAALDEAIPGLFEHEMGATTDLISKRFVDVLTPYQSRTNELIETVRQTAAKLFEIAYSAPKSDEAFTMVRQPYWVTQKWPSTLNPIPAGALDALLPKRIQKRRILKRMHEQINSLILHNVENLRWATLQSINDSFAHYASDLDERLTETLAATQGAIQAAIECRQQRSETVAPELTRVKTSIVEFSALQTKLEQG